MVRFKHSMNEVFNVEESSELLIQKIYEVDPLTCPKCQGQMRILSLIEDQEVIKTILKHLGLWLVTRKPQPRANAPPIEFHIEYSDAQIPPSDEYLYSNSMDVCVS